MLLGIAMVTGCATLQAQETHGPQPIQKGLVSWELRDRGAQLMDDFSAAEVDLERWRIWHMDPDDGTMAIDDGRLILRSRGPIAHNGLWSPNAQKFKDVTLVGRMNIASTAPEAHNILLHLCGGDSPHSPDHWVEIGMRDLGGNQARFSVIAAVPTGHFSSWGQQVDLDRGDEDGFLTRVSLDGSTNLCTTDVRDSSGQWHAIADPVLTHLRTTHCEIKMRDANADADAESNGWFEDVRIYPRAASHPVMVRFRRTDGSHIFDRGAGGHEWPPKIRVEGKGEGTLEELVVELLTEDGTVVCSVQSNNLGDYMLPLDDAPWDVYPVAAKVRLRLGDLPLGEVTIPREGLEGLYPDDVYDLTLE